MKSLLPVLLVISLLAGCASSQVQEQFNKSVEGYNTLVHSADWDSAGLFAASSIMEEYQKRADAAKDVRIIDNHVKSQKYDAAKREAVVIVEIEYYRTFNPVVRTLADKQHWAYLDENGMKAWKLESLLPEFK